MTVRVTRKTARLLKALLDARNSFPVPSRDLMRDSRVTAGSYYVLMARLETAGWVESEWEVVPEDEVRPRRRFYRFTEQGVTLAEQAVKEDAVRFTLWDMIKKGLKK